MFFLNCIIITYLIKYSFCDMNIVILNSNGSAVVGKKLFSEYENKPYAVFWRIPYAEAPLHELRFKPPKSNQNWIEEKTYDFSKPYNDSCASGSKEDCLYLSIYMPLADSHNCTFPVVVWIYEQSYLHGPDFFIDEEVLVITVSYRTALLGFLNTGDNFAKGNMGAKDVLMSLKWIRENIILFNGDVNRVTVMGSGTGGDLVASLLLSPAAEDLFNRVIVQSGSALSPADYNKNSFEIMKRIYEILLGFNKKFDRETLYEILVNASVDDLMSIKDLFDSTEVRDQQRLINSFGPSIEFAKKHAFIHKHPIDIYKRGMANNNVDVMMGYTNLECLHKLKGFAKNRKLLKYLNYNFQYLLPFEGPPDDYESQRYKKIRRKIMDFYFVNGTIGERSLRRYAKYLSDQVIYPLLRQAKLHSEASCNNVYLYRFSYKGTFNSGWDLRGLNYSGAKAGDEICYLFRCKSVNDAYRSAEPNEKEFIKKIARLWANFAKCGNPTPEDKEDLLGELKWNPIIRDVLNGINLGNTVKTVNLPEEKRMKFWDDLRNEFFPDKILREEL